MVLYNNTTKDVSCKAENQNKSLQIKALPWRFQNPDWTYNNKKTDKISIFVK